MKWSYGYMVGLLAALAAHLPAAETPPVQLCEPWESQYSGEDATGEHVIGLWQFNAGAETKDDSGHAHDLALQGAKGNAQGRFGGAMESAPGWPKRCSPEYRMMVWAIGCRWDEAARSGNLRRARRAPSAGWIGRPLLPAASRG